VNNDTEPTSSMGSTRLPPDYKQIRKYLRSIDQREALDRFIKAGWTPAELAEYARSMYLTPGKTYPTAASFQFVMEYGPEYSWAKDALAYMRAPGYTLPPSDRPLPKYFAWDDPDNPEHTPELKAEVDQLARIWRARSAHQYGRPLPDPNAPIHKGLWKRCYRIRNRYHSLEATLEVQGLKGYADSLVVRGLAEQSD
jgi:hypothetical protein